ncbi:hypothetical protein [Methanoregula sp.]|jgi:hypothetical protein|uniref:hypothetical protein n=1 Tax=Methanoregula sp. TaxID=2052170 RepID=UPI003C28E553
MPSAKFLLNALLAGVLVSFLLITGCTSTSASVAGTYTAAGDSDHTTLQLNNDGTGMGSSDTSSPVADTWTVQGKTLTVCIKDTDQCTTGNLNDDGSIDIGQFTFRKD